MAARTYEFVQLDIFTRTPLTSNPLAVFTDTRGLTDKEMQALAREMNSRFETFPLRTRHALSLSEMHGRRNSEAQFYSSESRSASNQEGRERNQ
jgi:Phenazine biosynthesis-like protein